MPNEFLSGIAFVKQTVWSLDGFKSEILMHDGSTEHAVVKRIPTPGSRAVGLFFDGADLWSMDETTQKLYRYQRNRSHRGQRRVRLGRSFSRRIVLNEGRVWMLAKKSREIQLFRLEDPLRRMASYDLDSFLEGSTPTALTIDRGTLWLTTENPTQLLKIPSET